MGQEDIADPGAVRCAGCGRSVDPGAVEVVRVAIVAGTDDNVQIPVESAANTCGQESCRQLAEARLKGGRPNPKHESGADAVAAFDARWPA